MAYKIEFESVSVDDKKKISNGTRKKVKKKRNYRKKIETIHKYIVQLRKKS